MKRKIWKIAKLRIVPDLKPLLRSVLRLLPSRAQSFSRLAYARVRSVLNVAKKKRLFGDKAELVPPLHLMYDGNRDYDEFKQNGIIFSQRFVAFGLRPRHRVLDIGCGIGRKTIPLLDYLTTGSYEGIDPVKGQVHWCSEKITPRYPNFRFHWADLSSKYYNPKGTIPPSSYVFPFRDGEFDFAILSSVFTHMFSGDMVHYISEIARLLKPGATGLVTFFLLNSEATAHLAAGQSTVNLVFEYENGSRADNPHGYETAVGHEEAFVVESFLRHGLSLEIKYGSWCGRTIGKDGAKVSSYQDFAKLTRL